LSLLLPAWLGWLAGSIISYLTRGVVSVPAGFLAGFLVFWAVRVVQVVNRPVEPRPKAGPVTRLSSWSFDGARDIFAPRGHFSRSPIDKNWGLLASGLDHDSSIGGRQLSRSFCEQELLPGFKE
jgi:hypothetical protein